MPNKVKYNSTGTEANSLFKGNWAINLTGENTGGGPSSTTNLYNGVEVPDSGYVVYNNGTAFTASNETELLEYIGTIGGDSSSFNAAVEWALTQDSVFINNKDFNDIITDGLILNLEASHITSYPRGGGSWKSLAASNISTSLLNTPEFLTPNGGSMSFDGVDSSATIEGSGDLNFGSTDVFTIEVWVNPVQNPSSGNTAGIVCKSHCVGIDYYFPSSGNFIRAGFRNAENGQNSFNDPSIRIPNNEWTHAVFTYTPNSTEGMKLYINGELNSTQSNVGISEFANSSKNWEIGSNAVLGGTSTRMNIQIAATRMYNRALDAEEILQNYNATKYSYVNLFKNGSFKLGNENFSNATENTSTTYNGAEYSMQLNTSKGTFMSDDMIEIDPSKSYTLKYTNRTLIKGGPNSDVLSGGHAGFACYNKDGIFCDRRSIGGRVDTVLTRDLRAGDEYAYVSSSNNGINWKQADERYIFRHFILFPPEHPDYGEPYGFSRIGFGDYNIFYNEITDIGGGELRMRFADQNDNWTTFPDIGYSTPAGTPVSNGVAGGTYNYTFYPATASYGEWTTYTQSGITGYGLGDHNFRPGTKYIKFMHLKNYSVSSDSQPYPTMLLGEVKFTEESYDVGSN